jgi:hypothetical protein
MKCDRCDLRTKLSKCFVRRVQVDGGFAASSCSDGKLYSFERGLSTGLKMAYEYAL